MKSDDGFVLLVVILVLLLALSLQQPWLRLQLKEFWIEARARWNMLMTTLGQ